MSLKQAQFPVVLIDRRSSKTPERHRPDLVGINTRQAAYVATEHLVRLGCKRVGFLGYHGSAATILERITGYRDALLASVYDLLLIRRCILLKAPSSS